MTISSKDIMQECLNLALTAYGQTTPNPLVGAVVVKNGKIVGKGYHKRAGTQHAEVTAIQSAGKYCRGADLYVTLEPCCHFGKTPPCTDLIIASKIKRVFYGMTDPNPSVSGKGLKALKKAGIKTIGPVLEPACKALNRPFIKWIKTGLPFVTAKIALTLDGKIADSKNNSKWISNRQTLNYTHLLRAGNDIIMVGANTAKKDKPSLNIRIQGYKGKQPIPIIVRSASKENVDLKKMFQAIGDAGFQSVLVEGGGELHSALLKAGLIDYLVTYIAPKILGGTGLGWTRNSLSRSINNPIEIIPENYFVFGDNIVFEGFPVY